MKTKKRLESEVAEVTRAQSAHKVDREAGVIRGVKLISFGKSGNGYEYTRESCRGLKDMYEGLPVNLDHGAKPSSERSIRDRFGRVVNVREETDGYWGDIEYLKSHPHAEVVAESAERMHTLMGMSHVARVAWRTPKKDVVESILQVKSCDLVCSPASTTNLFESQQEKPVTKTFKQYRDSIPTDKKFAKVTQLFSWLCEDDMGMAEMPMEAPPEVAASTDPDQALKDGIVAAMEAALAAFKEGSLDSAAMVAKIKDLAKTFDKAAGSAEAPAESPAETPAETATESLKAELDTLKRQLKVSDICAAENFTPSASLLKALNRCESEAEMKELVQESKAAKATATPDTTPLRKAKSDLQGTVAESQKVSANAEEARANWGARKVPSRN